METIKEVLMKRDRLSESEADDLITEAKEEMYYRVKHGEDAYDICQEYFMLEPDFLMELLEF